MRPSGAGENPVMTKPDPSASQFSLSTAWARQLETPLRRFLRTETGSAAVLLAATIAALAWANIDPSGYAAAWGTELSIRIGSTGRASAEGWGTAMSTDTAFALGMLALVGAGVPDRVSTYLLTFAIVDDVVALIIIALAYSGHIDLVALAAGLVILGVAVVARGRSIRNGPVYLLLGVAAWVAFFKSGVDPVVVGLVMGVLALAYPATRSDLELATESFRLFREQPTP